MTDNQANMLTHMIGSAELHQGQSESTQAKLDEIVRHVFPSDHYMVTYRGCSHD